MKQPAPDLIVAGKYCLDRQLASGGMGSVWVARHLDLDLDVAIKFMDPDCATDEGRVRFELEAKAAAHLQSPYVVNVLDYGIDDELPYIVMELLNGEDLEDRLQREGRISLEEAQKFLTQAAKALRRAQELGIIHRDIKPHNLFLSKEDDNEETLKILDFGIAKETGPALVGEGTNTGHIVGSPNYMSPEHVRGARDIDSRSDLWSLGVVIFQAVTGRLPFPGDVVGDVIGMILADPIPRATEIAPDLPPAIDDFFYKALNRDRALRFQTAREMSDAFAELVVRMSIPPGTRDSLPHGAPLPTHRKDAPTLALEEQAAKGVTAAVPNEDTLAKNAVLDNEKAARRSGTRRGAVAAASVLLLAGAILIVLLRIGGSKDGEIDGAPTQAGVASGAPVAAPQASPTGATNAQAQGAQQNAGTAPTSGQPLAGDRTAPYAQQDRTGGAGQTGQGSPSESAQPTAPTAPGHVGDSPAFGFNEPGTSQTTPAKPATTPTGKAGPKGTAKAPATAKPAGSWGF